MDFGNLDDWKTDPRACTTGMPLDLGRGRTLFVRRAGTVSREFVAACAARSSAGIDPDDPDEQMVLYARSVVVGWEGITDAKDAPIPYTAEGCIELFRAYPEIWAQVCAVRQFAGELSRGGNGGSEAASKTAVRWRDGAGEFSGPLKALAARRSSRSDAQ